MALNARLCWVVVAAGLLVGCTEDATGSGGGAPVPVVQFRSHDIVVTIGDSVTIGVLPMLPPGYVPEVTWSSSNPSVATVEPAGTRSAWLRGVSPGEAVIRASGDGAGDEATVVVTADGR